MTFEEYPNAIERVLSRASIVKERGIEWMKTVRDAFKAKHKLDYRTDEAIPQWAIDILKDKTFGYGTRIRIVMAHQFDITDTNPSKVFITNKDVSAMPDKPVPEWLSAHRVTAQERANAILNKYN